MAQTKPTIYLFPGQGSDKHLFDSLSIDTSFNVKVIEYGTPKKGISMCDFAKELSAQIDTTQAFSIIGVSLGGMLCVEMAEFLKPQKTIIISSVKNRNEFPFRYKFQKTVPIYKLFPGSILLAGAKILQPIVEPDRNKNKKVFIQMLGRKNATYVKRTVDLIVSWERKNNTSKIYHIHGNNDHTLPLKKIKKTDCVIEKGSHMMTLTRAKDISKAINSILLN